jgi:hypothetical protein
MMRLRPVVGVAIVLLLSALAVRYGLNALASRKREAGYQAALREYSKDIRPGLTCKDVRGHLRAKHIDYKQ